MSFGGVAVPMPLSLLSLSSPDESSDMPDLPELSTPVASSQAEDDEVELQKEKDRERERRRISNGTWCLSDFNSLVVFIDGANAAQYGLLRCPNRWCGSFFGHIHQITRRGANFANHLDLRRRWGNHISVRQHGRTKIEAHPFWCLQRLLLSPGFQFLCHNRSDFFDFQRALQICQLMTWRRRRRRRLRLPITKGGQTLALTWQPLSGCYCHSARLSTRRRQCAQVGNTGLGWCRRRRLASSAIKVKRLQRNCCLQRESSGGNNVVSFKIHIFIYIYISHSVYEFGYLSSLV